MRLTEVQHGVSNKVIQIVSYNVIQCYAKMVREISKLEDFQAHPANAIFLSTVDLLWTNIDVPIRTLSSV